jgi:hypothetical protein
MLLPLLPPPLLLLLQVNKKLEEVLTSKNSIIRALQYDVAKVSDCSVTLPEGHLARVGNYCRGLGEQPLAVLADVGP